MIKKRQGRGEARLKIRLVYFKCQDYQEKKGCRRQKASLLLCYGLPRCVDVDAARSSFRLRRFVFLGFMFHGRGVLSLTA